MPWEGLQKPQRFLWPIPLCLPLLCKHIFKSLLASTQNVTPGSLGIEILELGRQPTYTFSGFSPKKWTTLLFFLPLLEHPLLEIPRQNSWKLVVLLIVSFPVICWERGPFSLSVGWRWILPLPLYSSSSLFSAKTELFPWSEHFQSWRDPEPDRAALFCSILSCCRAQIRGSHSWALWPCSRWSDMV